MIRLIQRRLIIPRGDTGSFSIPVLKSNTDNIAVFTIFDETTRTRMFQKMIESEGDVITIAFTHSDTVNLKPGKYVWDIKYYSNPEFIDEELVNGEEVDSYYAGFSLPVCEIRETADNYLVSPDAPNAKLSPEQLEIVTGAIHSLNEAIRKTQENVEHYPEIRDEIWYVWDAELGDYVSTGVRANGIVGNGIASAVLNDDYTLTLNFTDGTSFTSPSIRGETGNGIDDIVLNNDFTLTISYTDGESYTTPSIRGPIGLTPQFSIGTVQEGANASASITGTAENPVLNLTLPNANVPTKVSELENDSGYVNNITIGGTGNIASNGRADIFFGSDANYGVVRSNAARGIEAVQGVLQIKTAESIRIKGGQQPYTPITPYNQHESTFYGLAKVAGDTTQARSNNAAGVYTDEAKTAIQTMLGVPSNADIPTQVSELTNDAGYLTTETDPTVPAWAKAAQKPSYTAAEVGAPTIAEMNTAIGTAIGQINSFDMAVVQELPTQDISTHTIYLVPKTGETNDVYDEYVYINDNWEMVGNTQIDLSNYVQKTDYATSSKAGIIKIPSDAGLTMFAGQYLVVAPATLERIKTSASTPSPITTSIQHASAFYGLAKAAGDNTQSSSDNPVGTYTDEAKAAIQSMLDVPSNNDIPEVPVQDVQVNGVSVLDIQGMAKIPKAGFNTLGAVGLKNAGANGLQFVDNYNIGIAAATSTHVSDGTNDSRPITPAQQHASAFYGLAKAAGDTTQSQSNNAVGQYTDEAKAAIQTMLDVPAKSDIPDVPVQGVQVNGVSVLGQDGVANVPVAASGGNYGVVRIDTGFGIASFNNNGTLMIMPSTSELIKTGTNAYRPIVATRQHESTFYGLAKAAGDSTQSTSSNPVGTYTDEAKAAIQQMLDVPSTGDIPEVPVQDVQVNGTSIVQNGVANVPVATNASPGVVSVNYVYGIGIVSGSSLGISPAAANDIKLEAEMRKPITPYRQHESTFYGLAKAAGADMKDIANTTVGIYPDAQKEAIQSMFGITQMLAPTNPNLVATQAYSIGDVFAANGHLYKATAAIAQDGAIIPDTNCVETTMVDENVRDVQVNGTSIVNNGVANVPVISASQFGVAKVDSTYGITTANGKLQTYAAPDADIKAGNGPYRVIVPNNQHRSAFYGLSKAAGVDLANETVTLGTYPETSKTAIKAMLGVQDGLKVVRLI